MEYLDAVKMLAATAERLGCERYHNSMLRQQVADCKKEIIHLHTLLQRAVNGEPIVGSEFLRKNDSKKLPAVPARGYVESLLGASNILSRQDHYSAGARPQKPLKKTSKMPACPPSKKPFEPTPSTSTAEPEVG